MATFLTIVNGVFRRLSAIVVSAGAIDADKVTATDSGGQLDNSLIKWATPGAIGSTTPSTGKFTSLLLFSSGFTSTITSPLTANRVISFPDKDGTLLTNNDWAKPGAIGSTTPNTGKFSTLIAGASIKNGATLETCSTTEPGTKAIGDLWLEVDGSNFPLYGWWWRWNGTYWLSPDFQMESSFINVATQSYAYFHCSAGFNYYFKSLNFGAYTSVAQSAGNLWTITLDRRNVSNVATTISSPTTTGNAAYTWVRSVTSILTQVNTASTGAMSFLISATPTGTAGSLYIAIQVVYNYARL